MPELPNTPALSVQIPTRDRPHALARCVAALAQQVRDGAPIEVLIGLDGPDPEAARAARHAWGDAPPARLRLLDFPAQGHLPIRRTLVGMTDAPIVLFMNDDVVAQPRFIRAHLDAHHEAAATGRYPHGVQIVGHAPWHTPPDDTLFDRLVRQTSLIFFFDAMNNARHDRWRDWGFRHFWTLNASAPRRAVLAAGGQAAFPDTYGHEDIELSFRLARQFSMPVLYRPEATAIHEHRYRPAEIMRREVRLGTASWRFARASPEFGLALFGRDVTSSDEIDYSTRFVRREAATAARLAEDFVALATLPPESVPEPLLPILSRQFTLLKRHLWRQGLLQAAGVACEAAPIPA